MGPTNVDRHHGVFSYVCKDLISPSGPYSIITGFPFLPLSNADSDWAEMRRSFS